MFVFFIFAMIFQDVQHMDENGSWHSTFQRLGIAAKSNAGSQKVGKSAENKNYNRYRDVVPYDHSLVRLRNSDTEYINANFVKVPSIGKEYILTQGPLPHTCKHFWEMIWEQNTYSIVMLNRVIEKNQIKCHQYWPLKGSLTAGDIKITVIEEDSHNEFIIRILELEHLKEEVKKRIHHFHYVAWPDFGVPSSPQAFLNYLLSVQEYQSSIDGAGPPVIHCSAGIGRSGTFALIDAALTEIQQKDDMMDYDVKSKLQEMRTYRPGLIQTTEQLHFSYIAILEGANMVAPAAYSTAYYNMAGEYDEDEETEEDEEEEDVKEAAKREAGDSEPAESEEPEAKEPRIEPISETDSESENGEDEQLSLSDVIAQLSGETGDESSEKPTNETGESGEDNGKAVNDTSESRNKNTEAGDDSAEGGDISVVAKNENNEQIQEAIVNGPSGSMEVPTINITSSSRETCRDDVEAEKERQVDEQRQKDSVVLDPHSSIADTGSEVTGTDDIETQPPSTAQCETVSKNIEKQSGYHEHNDDDSTKFPELESQDDIQRKGSSFTSEMSSQGSACSGRFSSDFNIKTSDDLISGEPTSGDIPGCTESVEKVVNRWQCSDNDEGKDAKQPQPKRSAMRRNSLEGAKRKSVTFVPSAEDDEDLDGTMTKRHGDLVDEKENESSNVRQRGIEERKRNLANKVDEIKKKMKNHEQNDDSFNSKVIGLVLCAVVVGLAYLYYYR